MVLVHLCHVVPSFVFSFTNTFSLCSCLGHGVRRFMFSSLRFVVVNVTRLQANLRIRVELEVELCKTGGKSLSESLLVLLFHSAISSRQVN